MKNRPGTAVYDFEDFVSVVASSNSKKVEVVEMKNVNVLNWRDGHSTVNIKKAKLKHQNWARGPCFQIVPHRSSLF